MEKELVEAIKKLIITAGQIALTAREQGVKIEWKDDESPVTNADKAISLLIFNELSRLTPHIPIICEERPLIPVDQNNQFWLVDPIDGTKSFIKNEDSFTINIALIDRLRALYGFVYQPVKDLLYFTDENQKFCIQQNDLAIASHKHELEGFVAIVSSNNFNSQTAEYLKNNIFAEVIAMPSSLKLCLIAEGRCDVYPKFGTTMEWDIAAGHALINAAGGEIRTLSGKQMLYAKKHFQNTPFIATSKKWLSKR